MSITNLLRFFFPEDRALAIFEHRLQSLPPDEQETFRLHRHPSQDKHGDGLKAACACARALLAEIEKNKEVQRVELGGDSDGWLLVVVLSADISRWEPYYRGFKVYRKIDNAPAKEYKLPF